MADDAQEGTQQQDDTDAEQLLSDAVENDGGSQEDQGQQFDADTAKAKIRKANSEANNLRKRLKELEPLAARAQELEEAKKTDLEKANERVSGLESRATTAELAAMRLEVALDKAPDGMPVAKIRALAKRLTGSSQEELEEDAAELFAQFAPTNGDNGAATGQPGGRPREKLRGVPLPGSDKVQLDDETDPRALAKRIPRR